MLLFGILAASVSEKCENVDVRRVMCDLDVILYPYCIFTMRSETISNSSSSADIDGACSDIIPIIECHMGNITWAPRWPIVDER